MTGYIFSSLIINSIRYILKEKYICTLHQCCEAVWILLQQKQKISSNKEEFFVKNFNPNLIDYF